MKKLKIVIAIVLIIMVIIVAVLLILLKGNNRITTSETTSNNSTQIARNTVTVVENRNDFYTIKNIVDKHFYSLTQFNQVGTDIEILEPEKQFGTNDMNVINTKLKEISQKEVEACKNKVFSYLDKEYIEANGITKENLKEKLGNYDDVIVFINNMYYVKASETIEGYYIYGSVVEKAAMKKNNFYMLITLDKNTKAFAVYPNNIDHEVELGEELKINTQTIELNSFNKYKTSKVDDETHCKNLFKDYKNRLAYDAEGLYEVLDDEYKSKRFGTLQSFAVYIKTNKTKLMSSNLEEFGVKKEDDYTEYTCVDKTGKTYIFKEQVPMKYKMALDNYTIDSQKYTDIYDTTTNQGKTVLSLNRFNEAINAKDYDFAYNKLAESFKKKNFPTLKSFEEYIKKNWFDKNTFEYVKFGNETDVYYTYDVNITDSSKTNSKVVSKTFIIIFRRRNRF